MQKIMTQLKENKKIHYILLILIGALLSLGLFKIQIRDTHDGFLHLIRLIKTDEMLKLGEFPMVMPGICNGAGYAMNLFYPPLATYLPLLVKMFVPSYATALKLFGAICIIVSGITMYQFAFQVSKKRSIAFFAAFIYMIAPYKLANVYKRYAIGEFMALAFIPWVFLGLYNLLQEDGKKHYFIAIRSYWINAKSYNIYFIYSNFCFFLPSIFYKKVKRKRSTHQDRNQYCFYFVGKCLFLDASVRSTSKCRLCYF